MNKKISPSAATVDKDKVAFLVSEYLRDPNCRPLLWIECESNISREEKDLFLSLVQDLRIFDKFLEGCEKTHP